MTFKLTPEQRAILDHPLAPLRVTAGAGTGKTTTMALRLGALARRGDVAPDRALGITFTNKAAEELAGKVRSEVGDLAPPGHEAEVTTYHGFAFGIVREFGPLVGIPRSVRIATPGYVRQLLRDALGTEPRRHLDLTRAGAIVDQLAGLSSSLGDHLRRPSDLEQVGTPATVDERTELGAVLEEFERRKAGLSVVDYADLVLLAHRIVSEHPDVAGRIRSRYDVVLLDEYQDTNAAQRMLLLSVFGDGFPVTAVGDTDQTIYEWRGASLQNFERFPSHFAGDSPIESLNLSVSWRSGTTIVEVANAVRGRISERGPLPELRAAPGAAPGTVRTHWLHSAIDEANWVAEDVLAQREAGRQWSDIAVLFRKHRQMSMVRDALVAAGVPVEVASLGGLLDVPEVADLHAWLRLLGRPDDAPALVRILLGSRYRLGLGDLAPLARWVRAQRRADEESKVGWALVEAIDALEEIGGMSDVARHRLEQFRLEYRDLLSVTQSVSLVELCRQILDRTEAWPEIEALPDAARTTARLNTYRFLDLAEDWSPLEGRPSLEAFLDHLQLLVDDGTAEQLDTARVSGEEAVTLLTVHRAKGLEWRVVYLPALVDQTFPSRIIRFEDPTTVAGVLPYELRLDRDDLPVLGDDEQANKDILRRRHIDGEWRTAYVAVTRAAEELIATGAWWYTPKRSRRPSPLFETIDALGASVPGRSADAGEPPETLRAAPDRLIDPDPLFPGGHRQFLVDAISDPDHVAATAARLGISDQYDAAVEQLSIELAGLPAPVDEPEEDRSFRTSVTGLVTLAGCPQRFEWDHIERLPRRPSPAARRGTEIHRRIELHHRGTLGFSPTDLGDAGPAPTPATETAFGRFLGSRFASERPILVESPFDLRFGDHVVSGRIDAIYERDDGGWEVVDFKSGRRRNDPSTRVQLEAYAVAVREAGLRPGDPPNDVSVTFAYLGGDDLETVSEHVDEEWLEQARQRLISLVATAATGPYDPTPGDGCRSCDFLRFCEAGQAHVEEDHQ